MANRSISVNADTKSDFYKVIMSNKLVPNEDVMDLPCPNCGNILTTPVTGQQVVCPNCKEALDWSVDGKRLLLSNPLPTYLAPGNESTEIAAMWERADQVEGVIDLRRRQATVELAAKWIGDRIALGNRNFKLGIGLFIFCALILLIAYVQVSMVNHGVPLLAFVLFVIASLIIPFACFFFIWSGVERFTMSKYIKKIQEERRILQEEEQARGN